MGCISVDIDTSDVLDELSDYELINEINTRNKRRKYKLAIDQMDEEIEFEKPTNLLDLQKFELYNQHKDNFTLEQFEVFINTLK